MKAHLPSESEVFASAVAQFEKTRAWLASSEQEEVGHGEVEQYVLVQTRELGRLLIQAHMDQRAQREMGLSAPVAAVEKAQPRVVGRNLDTVLGPVRVHRVAWQAKGHTTITPLDRALDLPAGLYSYGVQRFVTEQAETMSFDRTGTALLAMGIAVPKRQREQIVLRMAEDFERFYEQRPRPANDVVGSDTLHVMSADSVGVRVVPRSLREDTRKAAERAAEEFVAAGSVRGSPLAPRVGHTHDTRMAVVTMNWEQVPKPRVAADILERFKPKAARERKEVVLPTPQNRRVRGTLERSQGDAIKEMFDEAERRDPKHERRWVVLIDGSESQRKQVLAEANKCGVSVDLVLDIIHVLGHLWDAAKALHGGTNEAADKWVTKYVERLLTHEVTFVVSGLRTIASHRNTKTAARKALRKCASYFENNEIAMGYANALASGYPIATGNVEGACRHLVRDRMAITGAKWTTEGAEAVIRLRALQKSGDWDAYCHFHFSAAHDRTYPTNAKEAA